MSRLVIFSLILSCLLLEGCMSDDEISEVNVREKADSVTEKSIRYNVILIIADDASRDDFSFYNRQNVHTPNLDSLAAQSLVFNNAYLTTSSCSPSRISIITSRYPHNTGAAELETYPTIQFPSIAGALKSSGYTTLQSGKWHMGLLERKNFDFIDASNLEQGGEERWLDLFTKIGEDCPFFMWLASKDPHRGFQPEGFEGVNNRQDILLPEYLCDSDVIREQYGLYLDEISRFDYYVGKVVRKVNELNLRDRTVIIVCSDNGRPFYRAKTSLYDDGIKTPLLVYWPEMNSMSQKTNALVSSIDLGPTILEGVGVDIPESFQGYSFYNLLKNSTEEHRNYVFAEYNWHAYRGFRRMIRDEKFIYIRNFTESGFNGSSDVRQSASYKSGLESNCIDPKNRYETKQELYDVSNDYYQLESKAHLASYSESASILNETLELWMSQTKDRFVEDLTPDWYNKKGRKTERFGERGIMPGSLDNAFSINRKGPK